MAIFRKNITAKKPSEAIKKFKKMTKGKYITESVGRVKVRKNGQRVYPVKYRLRK